AFHARKVALTEETSAIEMSYHLTDMADEAESAQFGAFLRQYVDERLRFGRNQPDPRGSSPDELLDQLWKAAATVAKKNPGSFDVFLGYIGTGHEIQQDRRVGL